MSIRENIAKKCVHYKTPMRNKECGAGVNYLSLAGGERAGYLARIPCVMTSLSRNTVQCIHKRLPSEEEIQKELDDFKKMAIEHGLGVEGFE